MDKRLCANCGEHDPTRFENETFTITHAGHSTEIKGLSGWRCGACDEIEFDPASALQSRSSSHLGELVEICNGEETKIQK